ncbi:XRE family transcriptional regulator [Bacillus cereus]|uniref:XRE family transcriptional regulator n=1 Tax=Bacillus TaxID=1386 RepID=UPI001F5A0B2C|nr:MULTISPECIES: XRE family transcriptional regulator [Bacillus cereus group]MCU4990695.1 XRE family transcriptional regulator [Bacillus cereus]USL15263.1 XRE family transcriptional regulator [Bacillus thuringiensis]
MSLGEQLKKLRESKGFSQEDVTIDELIKGNQSFKEKIHIDEEDEGFEKGNEFGFYIGCSLLILSAFIDYEGVQEILLGVSLFMMVFYSDVKKVILNEYRSFFHGKER